MDPQAEIRRLQNLIDDPNVSEALKVCYLNEKTSWINKLPVASVGRVNIPCDRNWRTPDLPCPLLLADPRPMNKLIDVVRAVNAAEENVRLLKDSVVRVSPTIISRLYRGGKTTLVDLIARRLGSEGDCYVITITLNNGFSPLPGESGIQSLVRLIAYQMAEVRATDSSDSVDCNREDLLARLNEINAGGRAVILLIDELNVLGVMLEGEVSRFLIQNFLDKRGRYLIFSSHVLYNVDDVLATSVPGFFSPSNRSLLTLPLPTCSTAEEYRRVGTAVTDLEITLAVGIPSLVYVMTLPGYEEMSCESRFSRVMETYLRKRGVTRKKFVRSEGATLLDQILSSIITGERIHTIFEPFSTPTDDGRMRYALPYIPEILAFLGEAACRQIYSSLTVLAQSVQAGQDWELVVFMSLYIRSLAAKYCKPGVNTPPYLGPFNIATDGVVDVEVMSLPPEVQTVPAAVQYIKHTMSRGRVIYIFRPSYAKFPDFDEFISYATVKRGLGQEEMNVTIHGLQCKLSRGYPRHPVSPGIAQGWFLRGGRTVDTPAHDGWTFPSVQEIENDLLGFGLRILHPMNWGVPPATDDGFD